MFSLGVVVNTLAVLVGASLGMLVGTKVSDKVKKVLFQAIGFVTILVGAKMGLSAREFLVVLASLAVGGAIGESLDIHGKIEGLGRLLARGQDATTFARGFVTASAVFVVGPMTVIGCINAGLSGDNSILFLKSLLDGITASILASAYGFGVLMSALTVFLVQGALVELASLLKFLTDPQYLDNFTATGGAILLAIGFTLSGIKAFRPANFLPALVVSPILDLLRLLIFHNK